MTKLLNCPFCGGSAGIEQVGHRSQSTIYACDTCGCRLETGEEWDHGAAWNRRSDRAGLIAGLRECAELADQWSEARLDEANAPIISGDVFTDGGVFVQSTADANAGYRLMDFAKSIRARIAALEEEGRGR